MSSPTKYSIYANKALSAAVLLCGGGQRSAKINTICDRYLMMVLTGAPAWTQEQWEAVADALAGCRLVGDTDELLYPLHKHVRAIIADAAQHGLGDRFGIDASALAEEVTGATIAQIVAIVEIVERYRFQCQQLPPKKALEKVAQLTGFRIAPSRPPYQCKYCGAPSWYEPADQIPPPDYCHESDHGSAPGA